MNIGKITNQLHQPVLLEEVLTSLDIQPADQVIDATIGFGGHAEEILKKLNSNGRLYGFDQDYFAFNYVKEKFKDNKNVTLINKNFSYFQEIIKNQGTQNITKVLLDLGMSSYHIDSSLRGFSYLKNEPLDMRMSLENTKLTAAIILNTYNNEKLESLFIDYGEIRNPAQLINNIIEKRDTHKFETTNDLIAVIKKSFYFHNKRFLYIKTLSQVFQALRIEVNQELIVLTNFLDQLLTQLKPEARIAIITFHSLEARLVKNFYRKNNQLLKTINKKTIKPKQKEIMQNRRAKSAELRVFERI
ncbi:MAG: 16S rRNA (cytosine(1402)-N(4))-methyltransferase RsmH [Candidatus Margulisiibacteriota bacterium]|jgi:16S rRNA (cytosine1402-N4)-methyltransferase